MQTDDKLSAVVENRFPRFLANGLDYLDVRRTLDAIEGWGDWADAWEAAAQRYAELGERALDEGHALTGAGHLRRAALTLQFGQFVPTDEPARREALHRRQAELYRRAASLLSQPARPVEVPVDGTLAFSSAAYDRAVAALAGLLPSLPVDVRRVAVVGTSFGGHLALRYAALLPALQDGFAELRLEPDGAHSCNNLHTVVRPAVADRVCDRLA